ncbi:MAG: YncE family protein [Candidatus Pacebacteria bacterium]|nr:YncE family protein [Candidatus Paceibacterota bacterium]
MKIKNSLEQKSKKGEKFYIFALFALIIISSFIFLNGKVFNLKEAAIIESNNLIDIFQKTGATSSEIVPEKESKKPEIGTEKTNTAQQKIITNLIDPAGQLVHHLFNIENVPAAKGVVFTPNDKEIWMTLLLNENSGVSIFEAKSGKKITDINLAGGGGVEIIFSKDGSRAYVSQMETAKVFEINAITKKVLRVFDTKSTWTKVLELSPDGKTLFASNWVGNDVSEINLETGKLLRNIPVVKTPRGLYATKDGNYLYVAGFGNGEIEKVDLKTGKGKILYTSGGAMRHIVADEEKGVLYISDMGKNAIFQLSLSDDSVKKFADTDKNPNTIELSPDKKILYVSCRGENYSATNYYVPGPEWGTVLLFDTQDGKMLDAIVGGNQPTALDVSNDGKYLIFSDFLDNRMEVFEIPSYEILKAGNGGRSNIYKSDIKKY